MICAESQRLNCIDGTVQIGIRRAAARGAPDFHLKGETPTRLSPPRRSLTRPTSRRLVASPPTLLKLVTNSWEGHPGWGRLGARSALRSGPLPVPPSLLEAKCGILMGAETNELGFPSQDVRVVPCQETVVK